MTFGPASLQPSPFLPRTLPAVRLVFAICLPSVRSVHRSSPVTPQVLDRAAREAASDVSRELSSPIFKKGFLDG